MLEFHEPKIEDKKWVDDLLVRSDHLGCTYCFGTIFDWRKMYGTEIAKYKDTLIIRSGKKKKVYSYPAGDFDVKEVFEVMIDDAHKNNSKFSVYGITTEQKDVLESTFPDKFNFEFDRDFCDYIYNSEDLINLSGKKYHGKRNHVSKFMRTYDNWTYETMTPDNINDCYEMAQKWYSLEDTTNGLEDEKTALCEAFHNFAALEFKGGILKVDGEVIAFTLGEKLNSNTFCSHFEKALTEYTGAYTVINQEFAKNELSEYKYINREEDLGLEGLRKAKLSYKPAILLEKYSLTLRGE